MKDGGGQTAPFLKCQLRDIDENFGDALSTSHNNGFKIWTISAPMFFRKSVFLTSKIRVKFESFPIIISLSSFKMKDGWRSNCSVSEMSAEGY